MGIEIDLTSVKRSELTWFLRGGREILGFLVWIEINLVFVWRHQNRLDIRVGIEIALIAVMRSKLTWFLCAGSKLTWFWCGSLVFFAGIKIEFVLCAGRRCLVYSEVID